MTPREVFGCLRLMGLLMALPMFGACDDDEKAMSVDAFTQVSPHENQNGVELTPTFEWSAATGAETYTLTVALDASFTRSPVSIQGIRDTRHTLSEPLAEGFRYFWRVVATNADGGRTATNAGSFFRTVEPAVEPSPLVSVYHVSPDGEDNPDCGTESKPFKTLSYAATRVPPGEGDVIQLSPGTFAETEPVRIPIGVDVRGAGQDKTILSSTGVAIPPEVNQNAPDFKLWYDGSLIQLTSPHRRMYRNPASPAYAPANGKQTLSHFTIDGNMKSLKAGIWVENRDSVTMHHVTIRDCRERGAVFAPGIKNWFAYPEFYMKGIRVYDCVFVNNAKDLQDESTGNLNLAQLDGSEIHNIAIDDNEGYGIKFIYDGYFRNVSIHDCTINLNEADAKWGEDIAIELWNVGPGNRIYNIECNTWLSIVNHPEVFGDPGTVTQMSIHNVTMKDADGISSKEAIEIGTPGVEISNCYIENKGFGIAIWNMGRSDITVRNNIFYNSVIKKNWASGAAIYIDNSREWAFHDIHIYNNIFDGHDVAVKLKGASIYDVDIRNNAFINTETADVDGAGSNIVATHNLKFAPGNAPWVLPAVTVAENNIVGDPGFSFSGNRQVSYYRPVSASDFAVDKGVDVGIPFSGNAPDIGYFEFPQ